jgi:hypothetical protein
LKKEITFKNFLFGYFFLSLPFAILFGFLTLFHVQSVNFNGVNFDGWKGLLIIVACQIIMPWIFATVNYFAVVVGLWIYSKFAELEIVKRLGKNKLQSFLRRNAKSE